MQPVRGLRARDYLLLAAVASVVLLPGRAGLPPIDRDESRYMEATSQMLGSGDLIDVRFQDQPRYLQPAGIYWLEAASVAVFGDAGSREPWMYRIPSLLGGIASVLLTAFIGAALFGGTAGLAAGLMLASSVLLSVEARMATIDATLLAAVLTAQAALLRIYLRRDGPEPAGRGVAAVYWAALGVGLMLKGPVILLVSWGTLVGLLAMERRAGWLRRLHPAWGIPLMLAIVAPWCIAIAVVSHGSFFAHSVGDNFLGKVATGQQAHGLPPGYYLLVFTAAFWPGSLFALLAAPFVWAHRRRPETRFLLAWIVPTWIVFELVATKLPHYVLPTYPAIACLAAAAATAPAGWPGGPGWRWPARWFGRAYAATWLLIGAGLAVAGPVLQWVLERDVRPIPILLAVGTVVFAAAALRFAWRGRPLPAITLSGTAAFLLFTSTYAFVLPSLHTIWLSPRIAATVAAVRPCAGTVVASSSFSEPSLVFLLGRDTKLVNAPGAADHLAADPACALALIGTRDDPAFRSRMATTGLVPVPRADITGVNYSTGRRLDLTVYAAKR